MAEEETVRLSAEENARLMRERFSRTCDLITRELRIGGVPAFALMLDGMCDEEKITDSVLFPLLRLPVFDDVQALLKVVGERVYTGMSVRAETDLEASAFALAGGSLLVFLEESPRALVFSVQGFAKKSVGTPETEINERGSSEGFTDLAKDNLSLLRRRLRTPCLVFERLEIGAAGPTDVYLCYLSDRVSRDLLRGVRDRLKKARLDAVLSVEYLRPFLDGKVPSLFSSTGFTQRPDMLAGKLTEGRVGVFSDGCPFALIAPYLFIDYFHSLDDYVTNPAYAFFIRALRIVCFLISVLLPGLFVAACDFHPEVLPPNILLDIAAAEAKTPFSLAFEAVAIHLIYEIVREAGIRMPKTVGHAVSIVGALVVGDAAVNAGLIAAPMLMVVAFTAISSAVISRLHDSVALIRLGMILLGGTLGFYGIFLGFGLLLADVCSIRPFGVPFSAPFSPYVSVGLLDAIRRAGWKTLGKETVGTEDLRF